MCGMLDRETNFFPLIDEGSCCWAAALTGIGDFCTCWEPVFEQEQAPIDEVTAGYLRAGVTPTIRPDGMCTDCAFRPASPERRGDKTYRAAGEGELERIATEERFYCHDGMRRAVAWVHGPSGTRIDAHPAQYRPPIQEKVPYKANGQPGYLCAGWAARRKALVAKGWAVRDDAAV